MSGKCKDCFYWMTSEYAHFPPPAKGYCMIHSHDVPHKASGLVVKNVEGRPQVATAADFGCIQFKAEEH